MENNLIKKKKKNKPDVWLLNSSCISLSSILTWNMPFLFYPKLTHLERSNSESSMIFYSPGDRVGGRAAVTTGVHTIYFVMHQTLFCDIYLLFLQTDV